MPRKGPPSTLVYRVQGRWPFPLDMLRRDDSEPASAGDAEVIKLLTPDGIYGISSPGADIVKGVYEVRLRHIAYGTVQRGKWLPAEERWKSFGWRVTSAPGLAAFCDKNFVPGLVAQPLPPKVLDAFQHAVMLTPRQVMWLRRILRDINAWDSEKSVCASILEALDASEGNARTVKTMAGIE